MFTFRVYPPHPSQAIVITQLQAKDVVARSGLYQLMPSVLQVSYEGLCSARVQILGLAPVTVHAVQVA